MQEVELKLDLSEDAADALLASGILPGEARIRQLHAVYFDTPELDLARAGLSLRIRAAGDERIQTIKADGPGSAGLFLRSEWEMPVDGDTPVLDDATPVKALLGDGVSRITPRFTVEVERRSWVLHDGDAEIEIVFDRGAVLAGEARQAICEIELELKRGEPAALFALARMVDGVAPVRLGVLSKAERGYRLSRNPRSVFKAEPIALTPAMTAAQALQHVAQTCMRHFRLNEAVLLDARHPEALHQARVALRRLRSAFSIFKPVYAGDDRAAGLREDLRWLSAELGKARDRDVLLARAPAGHLHARIKEAREEAYAAVEATLASPRARALMLDLSEWLVVGSWQSAADRQDHVREPARDFAANALDRFRRKVKKQGRDLEAATDDTRHEVRKDAKKLRYASEFFVALFHAKRERRRYKRFLAALEDLQDQLGSLNDLATAPQVIRTLGIEDDPQADVLLARGRKKRLITAAAEAHDALIDAKRFWR